MPKYILLFQGLLQSRAKHSAEEPSEDLATSHCRQRQEGKPQQAVTAVDPAALLAADFLPRPAGSVAFGDAMDIQELRGPVPC